MVDRGVAMPGLYIHVPFCVRKCRYCDFYSLPLAAGERAEIRSYLQALEIELRRLPEDFAPTSVYLGGGTPTALDQDELAHLLALVTRRVDLDKAAEWTCEANPGTLDAGKLAALRDAGVNRLSLGVQSFDLRNLSFLGRVHSARDAEEAFCAARGAGFDNINVDLMFGIPGAVRATLEQDLAKLLEWRPEHVACYALSFEPGTPLTAARDAARVAEVSDDEQAEQYHLVRRMLTRAGYRHYEISNFALPGRECRHNLLYWSGGEYFGCGPSAHSHWKGARWGNVRDLDAYCEELFNGKLPRAFEERLDPEAKARETLIMSLRQVSGVSAGDFRRATGFDYHALCGEAIRHLVREGMLIEEQDRLRLAERALFVSDAVFRELVA